MRDSDVIRYALKVKLSRLAPLCDASVRGRNLMPVFVDTGVDILQYFELDEESLNRIINDGVEHERRVEQDDIQLMAMIGMQRNYAKLSLRDLHDKVAASPVSNALDDTLSTTFRRHLYAKYVQRAADGQRPATAARNRPRELRQDVIGYDDTRRAKASPRSSRRCAAAPCRCWHRVRHRAAVALLAAALLWPATYRSEGTILIEQQEVPLDFVRSAVSSYADERVQVISQRVMTSANLLDIIEKYKLYGDEREDLDARSSSSSACARTSSSR